MRILIIILFTFLMAGLACCVPKSVKTVFESTTPDAATRLKETKRYILKRQTDNSDFNYSKLDNIDKNAMDSRGVMNQRTAFDPVKGKYKYYQFLSTFIGESFGDRANVELKEFHDILIIKTNLDDVILDAYQYTLEWSEPPLQYDVFKCSVPNLVLSSCRDISQLGFKRTYTNGGSAELLSEGGIIVLK